MKTLETSRLFFVYIILFSLYLYILIHVYIIQIKKHPHFLELAKQQYNTTISIQPERELIYDRHGKPLVLNESRWSAFFIPKLLKKNNALVDYLKIEFPDVYKHYLTQPHANFMFVKRGIPLQTKNMLEHQKLSDLHFLKEHHRFYPTSCALPIVGLTDRDNHGLSGIELIYDEMLKGKEIIMHLERDARSGKYYFEKHASQEAKAGIPIHLTIDSSLQFISYDCLQKTITKFNAQEGIAIIMDPTSGEILACSQYPLSDPNDRSSINIEHTKNTAVTESYELGSVMKVFTAMAALEEEVINCEELIDCENIKSTLINGITVNTWKAQGKIPFAQIIQGSNNIGIAKVAQRLGTRLYDHYKKLGFDKKTALNWPGEQKGFITPLHKWSKQSILSLSFGYEIAATLLQLAQAFCLIANNGIPVTPCIVKNQITRALPREKLYSDETICTIKDILEKTVTQGTAHRAALDGYRIMGKTGTANLLVNGSYSSDHNCYTFAGIIEKGLYKRVIVNFIKGTGKKNLYASQVAAPLFEQIAEHVIINDKMI